MNRVCVYYEYTLYAACAYSKFPNVFLTWESTSNLRIESFSSRNVASFASGAFYRTTAMIQLILSRSFTR